jgi:hypothetical protein
MSMLRLTRQDDETWLDCALRYGRRHGLETEVEASYHRYHDAGLPPIEAAIQAAEDWDCCDLEPD